MTSTTKLGILLSDTSSGDHIGFIEFNSSGVLVYKIIEAGLHVYAFKPINKLLSEKWIKEPLYMKHAKLIDEQKNIPLEILEMEALSCEEFLNSLKSPLLLGKHHVKAKKVFVDFSDQ